MEYCENELVIPLDIVRSQANQIIEFARESKLQVQRVSIEGLNMVVCSNSDENNVAYFQYLMNNHIRNINKLERFVHKRK